MTANALLAALDQGGGELGQGLAVLRAAGHHEPEALDLGTGDRLLLEVLRQTTGSAVEVTAPCPRCGELNAAVVGPGEVPAGRPRCAMLGAGGGLRQPTYADLIDLPEGESEAALELLRRCVVGAPALEPSAERLDLGDDALTRPLRLACVECGETIEIDVDVEPAVLERLTQHGRGIDFEVHLLAREYHWSLAEISALPDARRSALARLVEDEL